MKTLGQELKMIHIKQEEEALSVFSKDFTTVILQFKERVKEAAKNGSRTEKVTVLPCTQEKPINKDSMNHLDYVHPDFKQHCKDILAYLTQEELGLTLCYNRAPIVAGISFPTLTIIATW